MVSVSMAAWNHLCVTWTRLTGYVSVYVNATLLLDVHLPSLTRLMHDGASIRLGASCYSSNLTWLWPNFCNRYHFLSGSASHLLPAAHNVHAICLTLARLLLRMFYAFFFSSYTSFSPNIRSLLLSGNESDNLNFNAMRRMVSIRDRLLQNMFNLI